MLKGLPCHQGCTYRRIIPGNCHIGCAKPSASVAQNGHPHGIRNGWFFYPLLFDPIWGPDSCPNFTEKVSEMNPAS